MNEDQFKAIKPDKRSPYGPGFFKFCELDHGWSNVLFGHVLHLMFQPKSVVEFGCGTGATLAALHRLDVDVMGLDGSASCIPFVERHNPEVAKKIVIHDLAEPWRAGRTFDLAISVECLEHVPPTGADNAVASICRVAPLAVITACPPVGRNPLHLNEQPFPYWVEKFKAHRMDLHQGATTALRSVMRGFSRFHADAPALFPSPRPVVIPTWYFGDYIGVFTRGM